ncbi:hypothetical protein TIFTF001_021245 [Ficus carica]|uniref:Uncharacterized protein n=1 Tax=Ficus carica TaxID=3494 RepID=A0AA88DBP5_FICCA|nr:hypothetical protein TIFTF001_021245 [Ficus carica]
MEISSCGQIQASCTYIIEEKPNSNNLTHHKIARSGDIELAMSRNEILPYWNFSYNIPAIINRSNRILELKTTNVPMIVDHDGHV